MNENNAKTEYADIINLPCHISPTRPHMSLYDRAAQFAPFAALSGYEDMVVEEARLTESKAELSESEIELINGVMKEIGAMIDNGSHPVISVTYFKPDALKKGGRYEKMTGIPKKIDLLKKTIIFYGSDDIEDKRVPTVDIPIENITEISLHR